MLCKVHQNKGVTRIVGTNSDEWRQAIEYAIENYSIQSLSGSSKNRSECTQPPVTNLN
jgi:hypothetical protein